MIFPYLYADMSFKHVFIISILSLCPLSGNALSLADSIQSADTIRFDDGSWYLGEIADSLFNGYGKMVYADSTVYEGSWKDGLWDGKGEVFFPDGDYYKGEFKEHRFNGFGTYLYSDSSKYEGYWEDGMFSGAGTMDYADGSTYTGEWLHDRKNGLGVFYDSRTGSLLKGYFIDDFFVPWIKNDSTDSTGSGNYQTGYEVRNQPSDNKIHLDRLVSVSICYGLEQIISAHIDFHTSDWFFAGFQVGVNTSNQGMGEPSVTTDSETGEEIKLVGWDHYMNEVMTENTNTAFKFAAECGLSLRWFSLGAAAGFGLQNTVRNCKSLEENDSYFEPGTLYYRNKITGTKFSYELFTDVILTRKVPIVYACSLRTGWGNTDGFFMGISVTF